MPKLRRLDISKNRLTEFPWSSLCNVTSIEHLKLDGNKISRVDAFVDFPQSLKYIFLQCNRIATIPETFLDGMKRRTDIYLSIWDNPFQCDCHTQWIARLRRCVRKQENCVEKPVYTVRTCMLSNCNFHRDVVIILDQLEPRGFAVWALDGPRARSSELKCDSPREFKGTLLRDVNLSTCTSMSTLPSPQTTTRRPRADVRTQAHERSSVLPTVLTNSWKTTTVRVSQTAWVVVWKEPIAVILGVILAILFITGAIECTKQCKKRRQAVLNNMAAAPPLRTVSGMWVPNINLGQTIEGNLQKFHQTDSEDWSKQLSPPHDYEEIKDEDIKKIGQPSQMQSAYFRREIRRLDASKLYNQHRPIRYRERSVCRTNRFTGLEDVPSGRLTHHNRPCSLNTSDANLYKITSGRALRCSSSAGVLYRSGRPPPVHSRHRRHLKQGHRDESIEMSVRGQCSYPPSSEDCPPPLPYRERKEEFAARRSRGHHILNLEAKF
ncbi:hypothetical protein Bbelb_142320 [Branchiostoma belcheri]|nr:hypothetical protein Bbelb_142320 [Branchiostoma belcheri]